MGVYNIGLKMQSTGNIDNKATTLTAGNVDDSLTLTVGTANYQVLKRVRVSAPGAIGPLTIRFYDNTVATADPITAAMNLDAQPADGFDLSGMRLTSGILGWRITGYTAGNTAAYLNIAYALI